jgi:Tfp pilus assembly protein PilN
VSDAVARRARLDGATDAASALAGYEAQASHASEAVAAIALVIPKNASLSMLQISGDSVNIEGESDRSADVYAALRTSPTLEAVRLAGPLRQERQADDATVEHFAFVARLRRGAR